MAVGTALAVAGLAIGAAGAYGQYSAGQDAEAMSKKQAKKIKKISEQNIDLHREETKETIRRKKLENERTVGQTRAVMGGSGFTSLKEGTGLKYLDEMKREMADDIAWIERAAESEQDIMREEGKAGILSTTIQGSQARQQATASAWGTIGSSAMSAASYFK
jgi:hypothetical protein